jgi:hypothetical protein
MELVEKLILAIAIVWTIWRIFDIRSKALKGEIIIPPFVALLIIFSVFIISIIIIGASPFHLLWLFPLSLLLGIIVLLFSFGRKLIMAFLTILFMHKNNRIH